MKRRGFLKFLGMAAAAPVVAPLAEKCLRAQQTKEPKLSEADKWRNLCGYGEKRANSLPGEMATISFAAYDLSHPMFFGPVTIYPESKMCPKNGEQS